MLGFYQDLGKLVPTCRRDPSGLFWIMIELSSIKHNVRGEEENCCDFENAYEYNARCSSMVYQEPLWDVYIPSQSSFPKDLPGIILGFEGVLYNDATDRRGFDRERAKRLHERFGLTHKWDREERSRSLSNRAIAASSR